MRAPRFIPLLICLWIGSLGTTSAQSVPDPGLGMVWEKPADAIRAAADLRAMADLGVRAIRTDVWEDPLLFDLADTLGILVFQDLPMRYPTARVLADSLDYLLRRMDRIGAGGRVQAVGLAYAPDTTNPETCGLLRQMTDAAGESVQTYIISEFDEDNSCSASVDLVFLRNADHPLSGGSHAGELGQAVLPDSDLSEYEGAQQAEFYANRLPARLSTGVWTFLHRWADAPDPGAFAARPGGGNWGLHRSDGSSRPARSVVEGAAIRAQRAFPRPVPGPPRSPANGYVLAGWAIVLALLLVYATSPSFRSMTGRYFAAHGIYRTAVADDRDNLILSNITVLVCMSLLFGMVGDQALRSYADHSAYAALWNWSGEELRSTLNTLMGRPVVLSLLIALAALLGVLIWMIAWYLSAARSSGGTFNQVMTLSIWPRWPVLVTLPVVMLVAAGAGGDAAARYSVLWVLLTGAWSTVRTNLDATHVLRMRPLAVLLLWLSAPFIPILVAALLLLGRHGDKLAYLQQLAR
jgi:hypothetical protein